MNIVVIAGTNRVGSNSKKVALYLCAKYEAEGCHVQLIDLAELPSELLTPTIYKEKPESFNAFHDPILNADGVVFVVPEYNGSFPGVLKFYIDLWKYPDAFEGRCVAFVGFLRISGVPSGRLNICKVFADIEMLGSSTSVYS